MSEVQVSNTTVEIIAEVHWLDNGPNNERTEIVLVTSKTQERGHQMVEAG